MYAATPDAFTGHHQELADALGASATGAVANADLSFSTRLQAVRAPAKLQIQREVETAIAILAARYRLAIGKAEGRLRHAAARAGLPEAVVARVLLLIHDPDRI